MLGSRRRLSLTELGHCTGYGSTIAGDGGSRLVGDLGFGSAGRCAERAFKVAHGVMDAGSGRASNLRGYTHPRGTLVTISFVVQ